MEVIEVIDKERILGKRDRHANFVVRGIGFLPTKLPWLPMGIKHVPVASIERGGEWTDRSTLDRTGPRDFKLKGSQSDLPAFFFNPFPLLDNPPEKRLAI